MGKIGDLFVRLGLKKDDYSKGLKEAKTEAEGFGSKLGTIAKGVAAGFGVVAVSVGVVVKAISTLSKQNQTLGDSWNRTVASMKGAWDSFKTDVANTDFTGVVERARNAAAAAADYYNAKDWDFEVEQANRLIQAGMAAEIEALQEIARDQTKSNKERIDAINTIMSKMAPVYANTVAQNEITQQASLNQFISKATGIAAKDVTEDARQAWQSFIKWQGQVSNRAAVDAADAVNAAKKKLREAEYSEQVGQAYAAINTDGLSQLRDTGKSRGVIEAENALAVAEKKARDLGVTADLITKRAQYNDRQNDEGTKQMVDDVERYLLSQAAQQRENRRLTTLMHSLEHQGAGGGGIKIEVPEVDPFEGMVESAKKLVQTYKGNVDLLARPIVDATEIAAAGWKDAGEKFQTTFAQVVETTNAEGETVRMMVTPILENGTVLSPQALEDYISQNLKGASDMLEADKLGVVIAPEVEGDEAVQDLEDLQSAFYATALALAEYTKRMKEEQEAAQAAAKAQEERAEAERKAAEATAAAAEAAEKAKYEEAVKRFQETAEAWKEAAIEGFAAGCQEMMDQLMGLEDYNPGRIVQALLEPLADMAIKQGEILIAQGIGVEACKEALESLNGYAAIAAGVALVAIGTAAKAGLAALASSGGGSSAASTYQGSSVQSTQTQMIESELTVYVEGRISGSDIVLSGQRTVNSYNR
ncbi:MAG: hypothetical protein II841_04910 [Bacteroidales bacterium]|nr:hypothetical protein [Bacteroidales bacterium]